MKNKIEIAKWGSYFSIVMAILMLVSSRFFFEFIFLGIACCFALLGRLQNE